MALDLAVIEHGIRDAIKGLNRPYIREVCTYGGEFDEGLKETVRRFPAVWVTFAGCGSPRRYTGREKWLLPLTFVTLVGARNLRNEESTRHGVMINGVMTEAGTFQLLADVQAALLGNDLDLPIEAFEPGTIRTLFNTRLEGEAISIVAQEWKTRVAVNKPQPDEPWLLSVGMNFLLQPSDETLDLQATVHLEGDQGSFADGSSTADGEGEAG